LHSVPLPTIFYVMSITHVLLQNPALTLGRQIRRTLPTKVQDIKSQKLMSFWLTIIPGLNPTHSQVGLLLGM